MYDEARMGWQHGRFNPDPVSLRLVTQPSPNAITHHALNVVWLLSVTGAASQRRRTDHKVRRLHLRAHE